MECSKGWHERCKASKGTVCKCSCGGANHGKDRKEKAHSVTSDQFEYLGFGRHKSKCGIKVIRGEGTATVILTELSDNPGTSVTNAIEDIATQIYRERLEDLPAEKINWIEHYPKQGMFPETYDAVMLSWIDAPHFQHGVVVGSSRYENPKWKRIEKPSFA